MIWVSFALYVSLFVRLFTMLLILKEEGTQQTVLFDIIGLFLSLNFQETLNFIANTDV